jgi:hypothetical protein
MNQRRERWRAGLLIKTGSPPLPALIFRLRDDQ